MPFRQNRRVNGHCWQKQPESAVYATVLSEEVAGRDAPRGAPAATKAKSPHRWPKFAKTANFGHLCGDFKRGRQGRRGTGRLLLSKFTVELRKKTLELRKYTFERWLSAIGPLCSSRVIPI